MYSLPLNWGGYGDGEDEEEEEDGERSRFFLPFLRKNVSIVKMEMSFTGRKVTSIICKNSAGIQSNMLRFVEPLQNLQRHDKSFYLFILHEGKKNLINKKKQNPKLPSNQS